ncbi:SpoIIE family protein phosphatase [Streptomyces sp. ST2-7A]|nr:SpoIIE family protein phosphatase [Streptomyces sp. ST2-7A]MCE7080975.1 SpoIIE family protein phosphatase [Streptomyces sp. ST2-7A]
MVVVDADGAVRQANHAAGVLFPDAHPGARLTEVVPRWLSAAHHRGFLPHQVGDGAGAPPPAVSGPVGDRVYEAHPTRHDDGGVVWWFVDDTDHRLATDALRVERERTAFLAEASNLLLSSLNLERCMDVTARLAARYLADAALVIVPRSGRRHPVTVCAHGGEPRRARLAVDSSEVPGLTEALQGFPPVPSRWIDPASAPDWVVPEGFGEVGSLVVTPLPGHGVPAGALVLLRRVGRASFNADEEVFARLFAARAGAAMSTARLYAEQASITEILMRELLPPPLHHVDGVEFAGGYRPSADEERIGGDFYDVHPATAEGEESLAVLGDVCGKGLEAAVLTGKIRNTLHALLPMADDHQRVLRLLNGALLDSRHTRFVTLVLASAVRRDGNVRLRLTSAGHPRPLIVRADGRIEEADTKGMLVGALPRIEAHTHTTELAPGESCLLFTDGITEARGGPLGDELFGEERLHAALTECAGIPAEAIVERVRMLVSEWLGTGRHDDMAVVAITAPRGAHLSAVGGHGRGRFTA